MEGARGEPQHSHSPQPGDLVAHAQVGARFGLRLAWVPLLSVVGIMCFSEMADRVVDWGPGEVRITGDTTDLPALAAAPAR